MRRGKGGGGHDRRSAQVYLPPLFSALLCAQVSAEDEEKDTFI